MGTSVPPCTFWSSWLPSVFGLVGTGLLAWSTWQAVQLARDRNSVMSRLLDLAVDKSGGGERLAALDASDKAFLEARRKDLDAADQQWTRWDTGRALAGVGLTILSYLMPAVAYLLWFCRTGSTG